MHWISDTPIIVETDASDYALGAILSIHTSDDEIQPVAFHSQTFTTLELNYDMHDKELLAIFDAFKVWCKSGVITSKALLLRLTLSWTTRTLSTFPQLKFFPADKPVGWNTSLFSIYALDSAPVI